MNNKNICILEDVVFRAVDEFNRSLIDGLKIKKDPTSLLISTESHLDSNQLVSFFIIVEDMLIESTGENYELITEEVMARTNSPFNTIGGLVRYIDELLQSTEELTTKGRVSDYLTLRGKSIC